VGRREDGPVVGPVGVALGAALVIYLTDAVGRVERAFG
jgi:hypothetical protein